MSDIENSDWLPVRFRIAPAHFMVRWIRAGDSDFSEPFFHQTIKALRRKNPPVEERVTGVADLLGTADALPPRVPAGVIFHVTRCGSTLLANAMRTDPVARVLSESGPFGALLAPDILNSSPFPIEGRRAAIGTLLNSLSTIYSRDGQGRARKLILKCHGASILRMKFVRSLWPEVPFLVVIREPSEVAVSNIDKAAGWLRCRTKPARVRALFGLNENDLRVMSIEEYCARAIGQFCRSAATALDPLCRVIDYSQINAESVQETAEFFGLRIASPGSSVFESVMGLYSKDTEKTRRHSSDLQRKSERETPVLRSAIDRWAQFEYSRLRSQAQW